MSHALPRPQGFDDLVALSATIGADPLIIQAAGGNTSIKAGDVMWIKASGTQLADAMRRDVFVPVDLPAMRAALAGGDAIADQPASFALGDSGLRPSIETSLHAVFDQPVVVHVHCVNTIALAIREDAEVALAARLGAFRWVFVPYRKPGANLARAVQARRNADTDVVVLGNHGLIVAAQTVAQASDLLQRVITAVRVDPAPAAAPDMAGLAALVGTGAYAVPDATAPVHQIALSPDRVVMATGGSLYPDHVIFCGVGAQALASESALPSVEGPTLMIVPGKGVVLRADASAGARALWQCLGDVLTRVPEGASLTYLTEAENHELIDWDAEKYRKALNAD